MFLRRTLHLLAWTGVAFAGALPEIRPEGIPGQEQPSRAERPGKFTTPPGQRAPTPPYTRQPSRPEGSEAEAAAGVVCHVKVLSDQVEDVSSLEAWKESFLKGDMTDRQKGLAAWATVVKFQHQDHCPPFEYLQSNAMAVQDPIKTFNVYGYGICSGAAAHVESLARYAGLRARGWGINNHSVPEVFWDRDWHLLDAANINFFPKPDGKLASVEESLAAVGDWYAKHPGYKGDRQKLVAFMEAGGGKGWEKGPGLLACCPFLDARGWFPAGEAGWYAAMLEYDGTQGGSGKPYVWEFGYSQGYQVNIQLRPGERLTRNWSNRGLHVNEDGVPASYKTATGASEATPWCLDKKVGEGFLKYSPQYGDLAPGRIGNGTLEYEVPLASGVFRRGALSVENLACRGEDHTGPALHVMDPARPGIFVVRMPSSYIYLGGELALRAVVPGGGKIDIVFSDNNGLDWKPVARLTASGTRKFDLKRLVFRRYDYRLKFTLEGIGTGLDGLRLVHDIQHSQRALPALAQGMNTIIFRTGPQEGTITIEGATNPTVKEKQLTYKDFHPQLNGVSDGPLEGWHNLHVVGVKGDITFPVETPGSMVRLRIGCHYRAKDKRDGWNLGISFDGGTRWRTVCRCAGPGVGVFAAGHSQYVTVTDIPRGTRKALVRWSGTRSDTTAVYDFRIDADYQEPHGGFRPVKVAYTWEENGQPRGDVHVVRKAEEHYRINCAAKPSMKAIALELAD